MEEGTDDADDALAAASGLLDMSVRRAAPPHISFAASHSLSAYIPRSDNRKKGAPFPAHLVEQSVSEIKLSLAPLPTAFAQ